MTGARLLAAGCVALTVLATAAIAAPALAESAQCVECLQVRVGPPVVVRGPFADELDAPFTALKLADGTFRGFSANGTTYAIEGRTLSEMGGQRRAVLQAGPAGSSSECGRWLTSTMRSGSTVVGFVHQERACDYNQGRTDKSMAVATSTDDGLTWTDLGTVIAGRDSPQPAAITGEGDCTMVDGQDGYVYAYCLRNSDWQTIVARASANDLSHWFKYLNGAWSEPGLGGDATAVGFVGPGAGVLKDSGAIATVTTDPWFGGVRLSFSMDKVSFTDLKEPLVTIDGSDWARPADTDLIAYPTVIDPDTGGNAIGRTFRLTYIYVPPGKSFESRYLVEQQVSLEPRDAPQAVQVGLALTRWVDPGRQRYVTSTGPLTGDRKAYQQDAVVAYLMTRAPEGVPSLKLAECSKDIDQMLGEDGGCAADGYVRERTAGWLYTAQQTGTVPVYRCSNAAGQTHFASSASDCEGLGANDFLLGYGIAP